MCTGMGATWRKRISSRRRSGTCRRLRWPLTNLSVLESLMAALRLRVGGLTGEESQARAVELVRDVGLEEIADRRVAILSGGQKRRLALALEMVSAPVLLLCDEVTSGLDTKAEDEVSPPPAKAWRCRPGRKRRSGCGRE